MRQLIAKAFEHVSVAAWKIPDVSRRKIVRFSFPRGVDHRGAYSAFDDERPFGSGGMPMKFTHHTGLELHRHAREPFGDGKLFYSCFLAKAVPSDSPFGFLQFEFETGQFFFSQQGIRHIILKTELAHDLILKRFLLAQSSESCILRSQSTRSLCAR